MAKKLTYIEVKNYIETESSSGCKLVDNEYINSKEKMELICSCGSNFKTSLRIKDSVTLADIKIVIYKQDIP